VSIAETTKKMGGTRFKVKCFFVTHGFADDIFLIVTLSFVYPSDLVIASFINKYVQVYFIFNF